MSPFGFAFSGIWFTVKKERNIKIHLFFAVMAILAGIYFKISRCEWLAIILIISLVLAAEIFNSAIESACDLYDKKLGFKYGESALPRNLSAGAVLILAISSIVLGLIIFLPYVF